MGTWGAGLFSDDTARDVKATWAVLFKRYAEPESATRDLLLEFDADDPDLGPVVILALAVCQWNYGVLQPGIKARALKIVKTGAGLHMWEGSKAISRRKLVYQRVAEQLEQPLPPRRKVKKLTVPRPVSFKRGELLSYRCYDGELILLWVAGHVRHEGEQLPRCAVMGWKGTRLPTAAAIRKLRPLVTQLDRFNAEWLEKQAKLAGERLPKKPTGLAWSAFAPRGMTEHGFDPGRIEVVDGGWVWDVARGVDSYSVPRWIEVGPIVAQGLTATEEFKKTLPPPMDEHHVEHNLPGRAKRSGAKLREPERLGIDIELPRVKLLKRSTLAAVKRSKHQPLPGDIFLVNVMAKRWVVGRVILNDAHFACGPADILVYFYKQVFTKTSEITFPMDFDLLIPPCAAHDLDWSCGEFFHVANRPLEAAELPPRHIFGPGPNGYYRDAWGLPTALPETDELVGSVAIGGIGHDLAEALGIKR